MRSLPIVERTQSGTAVLEEPSGGAPSKGRYSFISLGCPKNLVDSEQMLGLLESDGYRLVSDPEKSDFVVINTCGFIDSARKESFGAIDQMLKLKKEGKIRGVLVSGCLAERQREQLLEARPDIDGLIGVFGRDDITMMADRLTGNMLSNLDEQRSVFRPAPIRALADEHRLQVTPQHFAISKSPKVAIGSVRSVRFPRCEASMPASRWIRFCAKPRRWPIAVCVN